MMLKIATLNTCDKVLDFTSLIIKM